MRYNREFPIEALQQNYQCNKRKILLGPRSFFQFLIECRLETRLVILMPSEPKTCKISLEKKFDLLVQKIHYCLENSNNLLVRNTLLLGNSNDMLVQKIHYCLEIVLIYLYKNTLLPKNSTDMLVEKYYYLEIDSSACRKNIITKKQY